MAGCVVFDAPLKASVRALKESDLSLAQSLAEQFSLPFSQQKEEAVEVQVKDQQLYLKLTSDSLSTPFRPDFSSAKCERKIKDELKRRGLLLRAVEGKKSNGKSLRVLDFYSGFGGDAFLMACAGHEVISCEVHPLIALITQRAWENQQQEDWVRQLNCQWTLQTADSSTHLQATGEKFDVIYMDPMFEKLKASAKSPLPMQLAQALLEGHMDEEFPCHFDLVQKHADKIVVKMPLKGPALLEQKPSYQLFGKTIRFDVFSAPP